jgi:hypothetical protein
VNDFEPYVGENAAVGLNACFQGELLVDAMNLTSQVSAVQISDEKQLGIGWSFATLISIAHLKKSCSSFLPSFFF